MYSMQLRGRTIKRKSGFPSQFVKSIKYMTGADFVVDIANNSFIVCVDGLCMHIECAKASRHRIKTLLKSIP
jgi:hypothetical protein